MIYDDDLRDSLRLIEQDRRKEHYALTRGCQALLGLCNGMLADQSLSADELRHLDLWLASHPDVAAVWPGSVIAARVRDIMADGQIEAAELLHLAQLLRDLTGDSVASTGAVDAIPTRLPVDADAVINVEAHTFCFTGEFMFGTRAACIRATTARGGGVIDTVTKKLDYLVIGSLASPSWMNTSYGRKIEKAAQIQAAGGRVVIVAEPQWFAAL